MNEYIKLQLERLKSYRNYLVGNKDIMELLEVMFEGVYAKGKLDSSEETFQLLNEKEDDSEAAESERRSNDLPLE